MPDMRLTAGAKRIVDRLTRRKPKNSSGRTGGAYTVDDRDVVRDLGDLPDASIGAPLPCVISSEHHLAVVYRCDEPDPDWDGSYCEIVSTESAEQSICVVTFNRVKAHFFGPPNDEAFIGHPLADRGLCPHGAYEIVSSSWIRALERMNSVHPGHSAKLFAPFRHYVLAFHDTTFECIALHYGFHMRKGDMRRIASEVCESL
jgi:hypothetical protein